MEACQTKPGSSGVSLDSLDRISSDSSSLDVDLLDLNSSSSSDDDDDEYTSCSDVEDNPTTSGLSGQEGNESRGTTTHRKPPPLQLPGIGFSKSPQEDSVDNGMPSARRSARSDRVRVDRLSALGSGEQAIAKSSQGSHVHVSVDLLTPSFDMTIPIGHDTLDTDALRSLRVKCAQNFGVRNDRIRLYNLSSIPMDGNGSSSNATKIGIEIVGSEFTLEKLEELLQTRDRIDRSEIGTKDHPDTDIHMLQKRVQDLENRLMLSETMRRKAHKALEQLRYEVDLLESSIARRQ